ncbi:unnamed protein product [Rangifer tarandus platyrhynchus]|uniref:Uncharacterized protein n=2 Tax=Rangifer tarandus platyrhynchus TaxID=3082113 RepID=A0ABN8ZC36_RANTA|nr:unnamed protein product [Rangifer tarandus platyrhynchus]
MRGASGSRREGTPSPRASAASGLTLVIDLLYTPFSFKFLNQMHQVVLACLPGWGGPSPGETHTRAPRVPDPGLNCTSHTQEAPQTLLPRNLPKPQHGCLQRWPSTEVTRWDGVPRVGAQGCAGEDPVRSEAQGPPCSPGPGLQPPGHDRSASVAEAVVRGARQLS